MGTGTYPPPTSPEVNNLTPADLRAAVRRLDLKNNPLTGWANNIKEGISCQEPFLGCEIYLVECAYPGGRGAGPQKAEMLVFVPSGSLRPTTAWQPPEWIAEAARARWPHVKEWKLITWKIHLERVTATLQTRRR